MKDNSLKFAAAGLSEQDLKALSLKETNQLSKEIQNCEERLNRLAREVSQALEEKIPEILDKHKPVGDLKEAPLFKRDANATVVLQKSTDVTIANGGCYQTVYARRGVKTKSGKLKYDRIKKLKPSWSKHIYPRRKKENVKTNRTKSKYKSLTVAKSNKVCKCRNGVSELKLHKVAPQSSIKTQQYIHESYVSHKSRDQNQIIAPGLCCCNTSASLTTKVFQDDFLQRAAGLHVEHPVGNMHVKENANKTTCYNTVYAKSFSLCRCINCPVSNYDSVTPEEHRKCEEIVESQQEYSSSGFVLDLNPIRRLVFSFTNLLANNKPPKDPMEEHRLHFAEKPVRERSFTNKFAPAMDVVSQIEAIREKLSEGSKITVNLDKLCKRKRFFGKCKITHREKQPEMKPTPVQDPQPISSTEPIEKENVKSNHINFYWKLFILLVALILILYYD